MPVTLDLGWKYGGLAQRLSNLMNYKFIFDGVRCESVEGVLQAFKRRKSEERQAMVKLTGYQAFKQGQDGNGWKETQLLFWNGESYPRLSVKYSNLLTRMYDACFDQNLEFQAALAESGNMILIHSMGKHDPTDSVLVETEYIHQMYRLRARVQQLLSE